MTSVQQNYKFIINEHINIMNKCQYKYLMSNFEAQLTEDEMVLFNIPLCSLSVNDLGKRTLGGNPIIY